MKTRSVKIAASVLMASFAFGLPARAAEQSSVLTNGSFSLGTGVPEAWDLGKTPDPKATIARDTTQFQSGPASLRLELKEGAKATLAQTFASVPSEFTISGWTKTSGAFQELKYDLQVFDDAWKQIAWITSEENDDFKVKPSADWRAFRRKIGLPQNASHVVFYFNATGSGTLWLDEVKVEAEEAAKVDFNPKAEAKPIALAPPVKLLAPQPHRWGNAIMGGVEYATNVLFNPKKPELMYSRNDTGGIYRFDRRATRWIPLSDSIPFKWSQLYVADSFALDANNPNVFYVATGGGRWGNLWDVIKTTDGGKNWTRTFLKNAQGKEAYADAGGSEKPAGERIVCDPNDSRVLFYGTRSDGMFTSNDGAKTWKPVASFPTKGSVRDGITFVTLDWKKGKSGQPTQTIYAGVHAGPASDDNGAPFVEGGVYMSTDGGKSWKKLEGGPDAKSSPIRGRVGLDGALYVSHSGGAGLWKYAGGAWTDITPPEGKGEPFSGVGIHPSDPKQLLTITFSEKKPIFYSRDGGATWTGYKYEANGSGNIEIGFQPPWELASGDYKWPTGYCATIDFDPLNPAVVYETDFSGVNKLTGFGTARARVDLLSEGREQMTCGDVLSPGAGAPLVSGVWDVGGFRHESLDKIPLRRISVLKADGTAYTGWDSYRNGYQDLFQLDANPQNPNNIVGAGGWQWNNTGDASYSTDNGRTFRMFETKPFPDAKFGRVAMGVDPNNIVWAPMGTASSPLYFTRDNGKTWAPCAGAPLGTIATDGPWSFYKLLAADRVQSGWFSLYDRRDGRFYRSEDGGATWRHMSTLPKQMGVHYDIHQIRAAPGMAGVVWASLRDKGLFASRDGGETWTKFPNVMWAQQFAWGKGKPGGKFPAAYLLGQIGGAQPEKETDPDIALYRSDDMGATWTRINDDQHQFAGAGAITGDNQVWGRVYICTGGRGVFYGVPATTPSATTRTAQNINKP